MKPIFKSSQLFYFAFLLGMLPFFGCGGDEDRSVVSRELSFEEFKFPPGTSGPEWQVSEAYIAELLEDHSPDWHLREDPEWREKGYLAQLLKQFGDIPEVRYLIAYDRHPGEKTRDQIVARMEAKYRLWPNAQNRKALEQIKTLPEGLVEPPGPPGEVEREWAKRDPEGYYVHLLGNLIRDYGDIPEVYIVADFQGRLMRGEKLTDAEHQRHNEAVNVLMNMDAQLE
ncbi:hypothetical protein C6496_13950 [Candidatus Poribacteria bacterium]|nr:MAG: hypothetical protein C6496_13950 [Candidatus Poribacteria bacterium]